MKIKNILLLLLLFSFPASAERVIIISVDSMNSDFIFNEKENPDFAITPNIGELVRNGTSFKNAESVLPAVTQVNHLTMVCGCYPEKMGFAGNSIFISGKYEQPWRKPELIKAETIFESLEKKSSYTSAVVAGKNYVGCPIWADIQVGPSCISGIALQKFPVVIGFSDVPDHITMDHALNILEKEDPDVMLINLAWLDPVQHIFGHFSLESWVALEWADYQIGRLLKYLAESGKLPDTTLIVTSDHGQLNSWKGIDIKELLAENGIKAEVHPEGSFAHIFLEKDKIPEAIEILRKYDYWDGIWWGESIDEIHLRTDYTGDIVVSLKPPYDSVYPVVGRTHLGTHGGLSTRWVPLIFSGSKIKRGIIHENENASLVDIVPTISELLNFPLPADSQGRILPAKAERSQFRINYTLKPYTIQRIGYIPAEFFILGIMIFLPVIFMKNTLWRAILAVLSFSLLLLSSIFLHIQNLYATPGIPPDGLLTAMPFQIIGSFIVSMPFLVMVSWFSHWVVGGGILALLSRFFLGGKIRSVMVEIPPALIPFSISQIFYCLLVFFFPIPYFLAAEIFLSFFWAGFLLSCVSATKILKNLCDTSFFRASIPVAFVAFLTAIYWIGIFLEILFPNYFFPTKMIVY